MAASIVDFIVRESVGLKRVYVHFFGGEPLIRPDIVNYLAGALRNRVSGIVLRFGITTNGTLLTTRNCEMLKRHGIGVQLSLDGSQDGNDVHRQVMGGTQSGLRKAGAFDLVKISNYLEYFGGEFPNCRMTVTPANVEYLSRSIRELHERGFKSFSLIPDADGGKWTPEKLTAYEGEMDHLFGYWANTPDISVNAIERTLIGLLARRTQPHLCHVGNSVIGITIEGDVYPCHDFAGRFASDPSERKRLLLGNVTTPDTHLAAERIPWDSARSANGYDCKRCWAKWVCAKGCPYMNYSVTGAMNTVNATYCSTTRINSDLALRWLSVLDEFRLVSVGVPNGRVRRGHLKTRLASPESKPAPTEADVRL